MFENPLTSHNHPSANPIDLHPVQYEAIKAITINPAKILGLDNRVGSIKVGKDADFVVCTKNILDTQNEITAVYVDGKKAA